jgi:hypothetical protein
VERAHLESRGNLTPAIGSRRRLVLATAVIAVCHWAAQWVAWATHSGQSAISSASGSGILWSLLSFPLFYVFPQALANETAFQAVLAGNSLVWGTALTTGYRLIRPRTDAAAERAKSA